MYRPTYKSYLLSLLTVILAFNFVDRLALGIVLQDIKTDLELTDTQLGFLSGIAFALFYSVMGIPIARWADRRNRVTIISATTALWSCGVVLCGMVTSYVQLLLVRVGIAVGEAGCIPPAHSLIADYFTRSERPRAVARYMLAGPLAVIVGYLATGWISELFGWRAAFMIIGMPGLVLSGIAYLTMREPRLSNDRLLCRTTVCVEPEPTVREVCSTLWRIAAFRHLLVCFSVWYFFGYGLMQWQPTFFIRSHGVSTGELGVWFAVVCGIGSAIGTYLGGELATRYAARNERRQLNACAIAFVVFAVLKAGVFVAPDHYLAFGLLALSTIGGDMTQGPIFAAIQTLVPPRMRAMSIAIIYLFANLIGMGFGPLAAGILSDALQPSLGVDSLRYALLILCPGYLWAAWHLWRSGRTVARDIRTAQLAAPMSRDDRGLATAER